VEGCDFRPVNLSQIDILKADKETQRISLGSCFIVSARVNDFDDVPA
jgi:hypothetical protein